MRAEGSVCGGSRESVTLGPGKGALEGVEEVEDHPGNDDVVVQANVDYGVLGFRGTDVVLRACVAGLLCAHERQRNPLSKS